MIRSMTAFARSEAQGEWGSVTWELRSVNHRYLECTVRMPEVLRGLEPAVREKVGDRASRGKIECNLRFNPGAGIGVRLSLNHTLARSLMDVSRELSEMMGPQGSLRPADLLNWPGLVCEDEPDLEPVKVAVMESLSAALDQFIATREREGERTAAMLQQRLDAIAEASKQVRARRPEVLQNIRTKLLARLEDMPIDSDPGRLEQELVIAAQKMDVEEELDRLDAHVAEFGEVLARKDAVGRRMDFLMQEFNREANTLSSKSGDAETTRLAVELKVLIEQMREQVQNVE